MILVGNCNKNIEIGLTIDILEQTTLISMVRPISIFLLQCSV